MTNPELGAFEVHGMTRSAFILRGALAAGAAYGAMSAGPFVARALAQTGAADMDVLGFALGLEELEAAFYAEAVARGALAGPVRAFAQTVGEHEAAHVAALRDVLGDDAIARPRFDFRGTTANQETFLATAVELEGVGVAAYKGAAPAIRSRQVLAAALSIHTVEARHSSWARRLNGNRPVVASFDVPLTPEQVLRRVQQTQFVLDDD